MKASGSVECERPVVVLNIKASRVLNMKAGRVLNVKAIGDIEFEGQW